MIRTYQTLVKQLETSLSKTNIFLNLFIALFAYAATRITNIILDISYAASQYPVPFYVGQTAFKGETLKSYYAAMLNSNTLDIYWRTQFIDFSFIAAIFTAGIIVSLFLARLHTKGSFFYKLSFLAAILVPLGASLDILENLTSFIMLSQPLDFANWIAYLYSSFAVLKFAAIGAGYIIWMISLLAFAVKSLFKLVKRSKSALA